MTTRIQWSPYLPEPEASQVEPVRRLLDPVQSSLIPAHVTLCREDELALVDTDLLESRLADARVECVTLHFGKPEVFHGHGILLPCIAGEEAFHALRVHLLGSPAIRRQVPHLTLAHPRNPKSAGNCLANANLLPAMGAVHFTRVSIIEQAGAAPWRVLRTYEIQETKRDNSTHRPALRAAIDAGCEKRGPLGN
ncbi:MAG: 2'-5' RNA ligase family protein [bacterium]|nr:2'-5' RNA ligase family protein [bacterium]